MPSGWDRGALLWHSGDSTRRRPGRVEHEDAQAWRARGRTGCSDAPSDTHLARLSLLARVHPLPPAASAAVVTGHLSKSWPRSAGQTCGLCLTRQATAPGARHITAADMRPNPRFCTRGFMRARGCSLCIVDVPTLRHSWREFACTSQKASCLLHARRASHQAGAASIDSTAISSGPSRKRSGMPSASSSCRHAGRAWPRTTSS